jgi:hypothetical protein
MVLNNLSLGHKCRPGELPLTIFSGKESFKKFQGKKVKELYWKHRVNKMTPS